MLNFPYFFLKIAHIVMDFIIMQHGVVGLYSGMTAEISYQFTINSTIVYKKL